ncbi:MAG TPA: ester cyclase [Chloroflexota bacterium]|nr:ester cyclase [Chloroflexota bacterium]
MSTVQNKEVVRRFITEVLSGGNLNLLDELLAPDYVNLGMGTTGPASFEQALQGLAGVIPQMRFDIEELVAEGDTVVARWSCEATHASGQTISLRGLTYYRVENGKLVEDDWLSTPDLMAEIEKLAPAAATS